MFSFSQQSFGYQYTHMWNIMYAFKRKSHTQQKKWSYKEKQNDSWKLGPEQFTCNLFLFDIQDTSSTHHLHLGSKVVWQAAGKFF